MTTTTENNTPLVALRLTVLNHPGVMSHICGMFARRAFNVESIFVMPMPGTDKSRVWLLVHEDDRLEQALRQTSKLHDVFDVTTWPGGVEAFQRFAAFMDVWEATAANFQPQS